jgi:hypothetical protein
MLEWVATPYGEVVPKFNGTLLASKVDPFKEARGWVTHHRKQIESADRHLLLGVGGGHQVMELAMQFQDKEFICIEFLESLSFSNQYAQIRAQTNVELILGCDEKKIFKNERVPKLMSEVFTILKHTPSWQVAPEYYAKIQAAFTAHDWKAFNQALKFRSRDDLFLNELNFSPKAGDALTAKDIVEFVDSKEGDLSDGEMIWMALGELIK